MPMYLFRLLLIILLTLPLVSCSEKAESASTSSEEKNQLMTGEELKAAIAGEIVFDSNRSGTFGIYAIAADGTGLRTLADTPRQEMFPSPSPDGSQVVYASHADLERFKSGDIWIVDRNGQNPRMVAQTGTFPSFSADGKKIYFERSAKQVIELDLESKSEREIFPGRHKGFAGTIVRTPRVSPDGKYLGFSSDSPFRWRAWFVGLDSDTQVKIGAGCEPGWFHNSTDMVWAKASWTNAGSGIMKFSRELNESETLVDRDDPYGHEYFPTLSADDSFLLHSACPGDQHSHNDSNYQVFITRLSDGTRYRVTNDAFNNRWPKVLPASK